VATSDVLFKAESRLRQRGVRYTRARQLVMERLLASSGPVTVAELEEGLRGRVPTSSIYRTLGALEDADIVDKHHDVSGLARYEIAEDLTGHHHHHLVCLGCGEAHDVDITPVLEQAITSFVAAAGERFDFEVVDHRLDLHGWCSRCRS
jgi:Fur family transcriptional regulator, ferric uptake regulator